MPKLPLPSTLDQVLPLTSPVAPFQPLTAPAGPSTAAQVAPGPAFHVLDRQRLWTITQSFTQIFLNNDATSSLRPPRSLDVKAIDVINALHDLEFSHPQVKAVRQPTPGLFSVTSNSGAIKRRFEQHFGFTVNGYAPHIQGTVYRPPPTYVNIRNASPELPDAAVIARLRCYGEVLSFRRCLHRDSNIENGFRTARMRIRTPIPLFVRLASESIHIVYDRQPKTCKRCNRVGHDGRDCNVYACYNCDEIGHIASRCVQPTACSICKSAAHKAYSCPYAVIDNLAPNAPISESLASALNAVPVVPSASPSVETHEDNLTEARDLPPETTNNNGNNNDNITEGHHSSSTANTAIVSTVDHPAASGEASVAASAEASVEASVAAATEPVSAVPPEQPVTQRQDMPPPLPPKPRKPPSKVKESQGKKTKESASKAKSSRKTPPKVSPTLPAAASAPDVLDNVSIASSSKRQAASKEPSEDDPDLSPFIRRSTRPVLYSGNPRKKKDRR